MILSRPILQSAIAVATLTLSLFGCLSACSTGADESAGGPGDYCRLPADCAAELYCIQHVCSKYPNSNIIPDNPADGDADASDGDADETESEKDADFDGDLVSQEEALERCHNNITRVLMLGNSYTSANNLAELVKGLADTMGCNAQVDANAPGGYNFGNHLQDTTTLSKIQAENWDAFVLQNQSQTPSFRPDDVASGSLQTAIDLVAKIESHHADARIVYFVTWGRLAGDFTYCSYYPKVCDFDGHTEALAEGYAMYQEFTGGEFARVGRAFQTLAHDRNSPIELLTLYTGDGSHPSFYGSYLAAATIFAQVFNLSPVGLAPPAGIPEDIAFYLQNVAEDIWRCGRGELTLGEDCAPLTK